jgi:cytochrome c-type biogenesis protein CcmH
VKGWILALMLALVTTAACAQVTDPAPPHFNSVPEEQRFHALVTELRCVMCQNQSLADSNAQIAHDLRREVLVLMRQGKSDAAIRDYLVARYGEFVQAAHRGQDLAAVVRSCAAAALRRLRGRTRGAPPCR